MWIFTPTAFVSLVEDRNDSTRLIARARFPGDLARLFPAQAHRVTVTPEADYRYRVTVGREDAVAAMASAVRGVTYPNFKDRAAAEPPAVDEHGERLPALHSVWSAMFNAQSRAHGDWLNEYAPLPRGLGLCFADNGDDVDLAASGEDDGLGCGFCGDQPDLCDCGNFLRGGEA